MDKRRKIEDIEYHEVFQQTVDMDKDLTKVGDTLMILTFSSIVIFGGIITAIIILIKAL